MLSHSEVRRRLGLLAGGRAAAVGWGCGKGWELRDVRAELKAGSVWAEEIWRGGTAAASSSPEMRRRAVVLGVPGARDLGVRGAEWKDEDEAKLVCALEKGKPGSSPSCHGGGEVAAAELAGAAWRGEDCSSAGGSGSWGSRGRRVWRLGSRRWPPGPPERRRAAPLCPAAEEAEREGGGRRLLDLFVIFEKFRGSTVKQK